MADSVAAILMASGLSKRFGERNKLLIPFKGKALARYTLELVVKINFSAGIFFICSSNDVALLAQDFEDVKVIRNSAPEKGRQESVRLGLKAVDAAYYLFFSCDQPFLDAITVQRILDTRRQGCIVEPGYQGKPGNPCLFSAAFREELLSLKEGEAPRIIKARHPGSIINIEASSSLALEDIDDEETLERLS